MNDDLSRELLISIAGEYGTPVYVYNADKIKSQYDRLSRAFQKLPVRIFYAGKALTNINILRYIHSLGASVDCSSINEVRLALYGGIIPEHILYTSNSIPFSEIEEAQRLGVHINIDSLSALEKFGKRFGNGYPVGIRVRPNVMAGGNLQISTGHDKSKFGIPIDQFEKILKVVKKYNMHITVLHVHTGSGISDADLYMKAVNHLLDIVKYFPDLECVDLGGGFKVPFKEDDSEADIDLIAGEVKKAIDSIQTKVGKKLQLWIEPGKFLVSAAGYLIATTDVIKETSTVTFAGVDTGFNHLIRPMFYGAYHQILNLSNPEGQLKKYAVVGNICETDTFAWDRDIPEIREGDLILFKNAGAYGFEMASNFNSRFRPPEVLVKDGEPILIRRRESLEDLVKNQIISNKI